MCLECKIQANSMLMSCGKGRADAAPRPATVEPFVVGHRFAPYKVVELNADDDDDEASAIWLFVVEIADCQLTAQKKRHCSCV